MVAVSKSTTVIAGGVVLIEAVRYRPVLIHARSGRAIRGQGHGAGRPAAKFAAFKLFAAILASSWAKPSRRSRRAPSAGSEVFVAVRQSLLPFGRDRDVVYVVVHNGIIGRSRVRFQPDRDESGKRPYLPARACRVGPLTGPCLARITSRPRNPLPCLPTAPSTSSPT